MNNKNTFILDKQELFTLDKNFNLNEVDSNRLEDEIEKIIETLWNETCTISKDLKPLFSPFLQINLMRKLYIYYFSLLSLKKNYLNIKILNTNILVNIIGQQLNFSFLKNLSNHDDDFNLKRYYSFYKKNNNQKRKIKNFLNYLNSCFEFEKKDILFSDQMRLKDELKSLKRSKSVSDIPLSDNFELNLDVKKIWVQMQKNIDKQNATIPSILIKELVEKRVIEYLPDTINRIEQISQFIKKNNIKLVIASSSVHEEDLTLLVAAKICGIKNLLINHGLAGCKNQFLDNFIDFQVTFSPQEYLYDGAEQFNLSSDWSKL